MTNGAEELAAPVEVLPLAEPVPEALAEPDAAPDAADPETFPRLTTVEFGPTPAAAAWLYAAQDEFAARGQSFVMQID